MLFMNFPDFYMANPKTSLEVAECRTTDGMVTTMWVQIKVDGIPVGDRIRVRSTKPEYDRQFCHTIVDCVEDLKTMNFVRD